MSELEPNPQSYLLMCFVKVSATLGEMRRKTQRSQFHVLKTAVASGCEHEETADGGFLNSVICRT